MPPSDPWAAWIDKCPLRRWRAEHDETVMRAAVRIGVSINAIQAWERGANRPTAEHFATLATVLGEDSEQLTRRWDNWFKRRPAAA